MKKYTIKEIRSILEDCLDNPYEAERLHAWITTLYKEDTEEWTGYNIRRWNRWIVNYFLERINSVGL